MKKHSKFALAAMTLWASMALGAGSLEIGKTYWVLRTEGTFAIQFTRVPLQRR